MPTLNPIDENKLKERTKQFGLRIIRLISNLPKSIEGRTIANQLMRAGVSVGANYRAACRARSTIEFISRLGIVEEEADKSAFWLEMIIESKLMKKVLVEPLLKEANELVAIMTASIKSARARSSQSKIQNPKSKIYHR